MSTAIQRTTFSTSRLLDFFSEKELTAQIGHAKAAWPLVVFKELVDNALDACEEAGTAPVIAIEVGDDFIRVADNGPGIAPETVTDMLDFSVRVSSREAYTAPDRGAQGNALKTLVAMPFVLDGERGRVDIRSRGLHHAITCRVDRIKQAPAIGHEVQDCPDAKIGTAVTLHWPDSACSILQDGKARFLQMARSFAVLNPHLSLAVDWFGETSQWQATAPAWAKWRPSDPTSPHWYTPERLTRLVAANLAHPGSQGRTVRELVAEFRGLSSTAKQKAVLDATGLARKPLSALVNAENIDMDRVCQLLGAMKEHSKPVKPAALGVIGKDHLRQRFEELAAGMESFRYVRELGVKDDLPWVVETAFAWVPELPDRMLVTGVNWSAGILNPFRELGRWGQSMDSVLAQARAGCDEPVIVVAHMACPRVQYADRGKSTVVIED